MSWTEIARAWGLKYAPQVRNAVLKVTSEIDG